MAKARAKADFYKHDFLYHEGDSCNIQFEFFNPEVHQLDDPEKHEAWTQKFYENAEQRRVEAQAATVRQRGIDAQTVKNLLKEVSDLKAELARRDANSGTQQQDPIETAPAIPTTDPENPDPFADAPAS